MKKQGAFNRYVSSLTRSLSDFLNLPLNEMFNPRVRDGYAKVNLLLKRTTRIPDENNASFVLI